MLEALTFRGRSGLRDRYEAITPATRRLNEHIALTPIPSDEAVFRVCPAKEDDLMKIGPRPPRREAEDPPPCVEAPGELSEEEAIRAVLNGFSLLVLGIAGVGKTHFMQGLVKKLRNTSNRVDVISKTHCSSRRTGGVTADHYVRRHIIHGACTADYV